MNLQEHYAGLALQGLLANLGSDPVPELLAEVAISYANALVKKLHTEDQQRAKREPKDHGVTLAQYLQSCKENNQPAVPNTDAVFAYAQQIGLPSGYLRLAWEDFKRKQQADKRQLDWLQTFRNYVRNPNWLDVWHLNQAGDYYLTDHGKQLERELKNVSK